VAQPREYFSDKADGAHVLSIALKPTKSELVIGGRVMKSGVIPAGTTFMAGPISEPCRSVFFDEFEFIQVYISQDMLSECMSAVYGRAPAGQLNLTAPRFTRDVRIRRLAQSLSAVDPNGGPLGQIYVESLGLAVATLLIAMDSPRAAPKRASRHAPLAKWRLNRVFEYIESNINKSISLSELAGVSLLSRMHFAAQFKSATGQTPHMYVLARKIARSQELLRDTRRSIGEIAVELDFSSNAHFTHVFKGLVGETPSQYRRRLDI
jgi:AraC family transcriptional regulator